MYFCPCYWSFIAETKVTKRAEIQIPILALNFYMWKRFTGQQYFYIHKRKGHKVLKKRRKGSRQLRKKEEYPFLWTLYAPPSSPLFFFLLLLFAFFGIFKDLGRWGLPLGFSSLKKCHTEGRSEWRNIKASTGRRTEEGVSKCKLITWQPSIYKSDSSKGKEKTISLLKIEYRNGHFLLDCFKL